MLSLRMIYENDNYELLSIKTITNLNGNYLRYDIYMRIKITNKIIYSQVDPSLFEYLSTGYSKKQNLVQIQKLEYLLNHKIGIN